MGWFTFYPSRRLWFAIGWALSAAMVFAVAYCAWWFFHCHGLARALFAVFAAINVYNLGDTLLTMRRATPPTPKEPG